MKTSAHHMSMATQLFAIARDLHRDGDYDGARDMKAEALANVRAATSSAPPPSATATQFQPSSPAYQRQTNRFSRGSRESRRMDAVLQAFDSRRTPSPSPRASPARSQHSVASSPLQDGGFATQQTQQEEQE